MNTCDRTVVVSHDQEADAAYVQFPGFEGETYPIQIVVEDDRIESMIVLDFTPGNWRAWKWSASRPCSMIGRFPRAD